MISVVRASALALGLIFSPQSLFANSSDLLDCPFAETKTLATIDTGGSSLPYSLVEIRFRADGRPIIAYSSGLANQQQLRLINCHDLRCSTYEDKLVVSSNNFFDAIGFALSNDGRPLFLANYAGTLRYYECSDADCSLSRHVQIESTTPGSIRALAVRPDGRPVLLYSRSQYATEGARDIVHFLCDTTQCTSGTTTTLVDVDPSAQWNVLGMVPRMDSQGLLVASFLQNSGSYIQTDVNLVRCLDATCSNAERRTVSSQSGLRRGLWAWMTLLPDNRPLFVNGISPAYGPATLIECAEAGCENVQSRNLFSSTQRHFLGVSTHSTLLPLIGTLTPNSAGFYACRDADCTSVSLLEAPAIDPIFNYTTLQMGPNAKPILAYFDERGTKFKMLQCGPLEVFKSSFE